MRCIATGRRGSTGHHVDSENPSGALAVYERAGFLTTMRWTGYGMERGAG